MKKLTLILLLLALLLPSCATPGASQPGTTQPQTLPQTGGETAEGAYDFFQYEKALEYVNRYQGNHKKNALRLLDSYLENPTLLGEPVDGVYDFAKETQLFNACLAEWSAPQQGGERWLKVKNYFVALEKLMEENSQLRFVFSGWDDAGKEGKRLFLINGNYFLAYTKTKLVLCHYANDVSPIIKIPISYGKAGVCIGPRAFAGNTVVKTVELADNFLYRQIAPGAFEDCPNLEKVYANDPYTIRPEIPTPGYYGQVDFATDEFTAYREAAKDPVAWQEKIYQKKLQLHKESFPQNLVDARPENYVIENGVLTKYLGFGGHLIIPEGVTEIATGVFDYCGADNVLAVTLPSTLKRIQSHVFTECRNLLELTFPEGFEELCEEAIYTKLTILPGEDYADDGHTYENWVRLNDLPATCTVYGEEFAFWPWQIAHVENVK